MNSEPEVPPVYLKISGGILEGSLSIPSDGLSVGHNQFSIQNGKVGIGTSSPSHALTVDGMIRSTTGGVMFPDGSTQTTAAPGSCFGGICAGNTNYSGQAQFTHSPGGTLGSDATLSIQPAASLANGPLLSVISGGSNLFMIDAEGDLILSGAVQCTGCLSNLGLATNSVTGIKILDGTIAPEKLANTGVSAGTFGSSISIPVISVNSKGLISGISDVGLGALPISGTAGGVLTGSYPSPGLAVNSVATTHIVAGGNNSTLIVTSSGTVEWQLPKIQYGLKFEYLSPSTLRLKVSGIDGKASVLVSNGSELRSILISANLTANLALSGAGGLDTGSETANTGYDIYLITQNGGAAPALLFTVSGNAPVLPSGYTYQSEVLWFVSNTQGAGQNDIAYFVDLGNGVCRYLLSKGIRILNHGQATGVTALNFEAAVPVLGTRAQILAEVFNLDVLTLTSLRFFYDLSGTLLLDSFEKLLNTTALGVGPSQKRHYDVPIHSGLNGSLYYSFAAAPAIGDFGLSVYVTEWTLPSRMMR